MKFGSRIRTAGVLVSCCTALIAGAFFQSSHRLFAQTTFRGGVDLVEVDAVVLDASGRPIAHLTSKDFTLAVDGAPREIESIEYIDAGKATMSALKEPGTSPERLPAGARIPVARHVVFVVDEGNITAGSGRDATAATAKLLDRLGPTDRVALLSIPSGPSVDFTAEHEPIRSALNRVVGRAARGTVAADFSLSWTETFAFDVGQTIDDRRVQEAVFQRECAPGMPNRAVCEDGVRAEAQGRLEGNRERARALVGGLDKLFQALAKMQGPKTVVLVSEAWIQRPDHRDESVVTNLAAQAAAARVTLYTVLLDRPLVDVSESGSSRSGSVMQDRAIEEEAMRGLSDYSGGMLFRMLSGRDESWQRLSDVLSGYYLIACRVLPTDKEGAHRIRVTSTNSSLRVHARQQFVMSPASILTRREGAGSPPRPAAGVPRNSNVSRRSDASSAFKIDQAMLNVATRSVGDIDGKVRILFSVDVRDVAGKEVSALALGYKLKSGDRIVADSGRVVAVPHAADGSAAPISYIAFQGLLPGAYELQLSASDGSKHLAFVKHPVDARLHAAGPYWLSDLMLAPSAPSDDGPFPVPADVVVPGNQIVAGIEVTAPSSASFANATVSNATVRFELTSADSRDVLVSRDVPLSPGGPQRQFVRTMLVIPDGRAPSYLVSASLVVEGSSVGSIDAPFRVANHPK